MNEIQIIQQQLATERAHFAAVAEICAARGLASTEGVRSSPCGDRPGAAEDWRTTGENLRSAAGDRGVGRDRTGAKSGRTLAGGALVTACAEYFAFAVTRFDAPTAQRLAACLAAGLGPDFLQAFAEESRRHFEQFDAMLRRNLPVTEWRAMSRIDADSIFAERAIYNRVQAAIPT